MPARGEPVEAVIVGAGLVGCALAYHLVRRQVGPVLLLDRAGPGEAATAASAGILSLQGWDDWDLRLVEESAREYRAISEVRGHGNYREIGGVRVSRTEEGERWLLRAQKVLEKAGVASRSVGPSELRSLLPLADLTDVRAGLHTPEDALVDPVDICRAYLKLATRGGHGAELRQGEATVARTDHAWTILSGGQAWRTPRLVLACGAWTGRLLGSLHLPLPISPFRSQVSLIRPNPLLEEFPTLHDLDLDLYVRPAPWGRVLAGDGVDVGWTDPDRPGAEPGPPFLGKMTSAVHALFPGTALPKVERAWSGTCVATPDHFPVVGEVPGAEGLYVATGFEGYGVMRAAAIARRLAEGLLDGAWAPLAPADPSRFPDRSMSFQPHPEFPPLPATGDPPLAGATRASDRLLSAAGPEVPPPELSFRVVADLDELSSVEIPSLSTSFDPFLPLFMADTIRCHGEVQIACAGAEVRGVYLWAPVERAASVFTRMPGVLEHFRALRPTGALFAERPLGPGSHAIHIMGSDLRDWDAQRRVRNPARIADPGDLPRVRAFMQQVSGPLDESWFELLPRPEELCFLCEVEGRIAGVSWASVQGTFARGHSFDVHPRYQRLGIGTDLLIARQRWLRSRGVQQVISEIHDGNAGSEAAAVRAGMARIGQMFALPAR